MSNTSFNRSVVSASGPNPLDAAGSVPPTEPQTPAGSSPLAGSPAGDISSELSWRPEDGASKLIDGDTHNRKVLGATVLNASDPFDRVVIDIVETNRRKRKDYAQDSDPWSNFRDTAHTFGAVEAKDVPLLMAGVKLARIKSLRLNGRMDETQNEAVEDSILDLAVYALIALAMYREDQS